MLFKITYWRDGLYFGYVKEYSWASLFLENYIEIAEHQVKFSEIVKIERIGN